MSIRDTRIVGSGAMTEEEWLSSADSIAMINALKGWSSDRKMRLLTCGCCTVALDSVITGPSPSAISHAELHADGHCTDEQLKNANRDAALYAEEAYGDEGYWQEFGCLATEGDPWVAVHYVTQFARYRVPDRVGEIHAAFRTVILDLFGNPYYRIDFDPRWRTADTVGLARGIYEDRAFDRLPLLADALLDAGCADEQVLEHCRSEGPHVRGCWVVDLVLGKE